MAKKTPIDKLQTAVAKILAEYGDDVAGNLSTIAKSIGQKGAMALRGASRETIPVHKGHKTTGEYARGWTYEVNEKRLWTEVTIYNNHPALPHLLEYGHVTRNGTGRTFPRTPAHEHIAPVADELIETYEREVLDKL